MSTAKAEPVPAVKLSTEEKSRLDVLKREIGNGYAVTMADLRFLVRLLERTGL